jgi:hypothetical protein
MSSFEDVVTNVAGKVAVAMDMEVCGQSSH